MSEPVKRPLKLIYCYADKDKELRDTLDEHLSNLEEQKLIETWHDEKVSAGTEWEREIDDHLRVADIILLLVSAHFFASDYWYHKKIIPILEMHKEGTVRVIPIILRPVHWKNAPFSKLRALPSGAKPVTKWEDPHDAYENIASSLHQIVNELQALQEKSDNSSKEKNYEEARKLSLQASPNENDHSHQSYSPANKDVAISLKPLHVSPPPQTTKEEWLNKGITLFNLKRYGEALKAYEQALDLDPNDARIYSNKGRALYELSRYKEALRACKRAIRLDPNNVHAHTGKGAALYGLKKYEEALRACEQALRLDPNDAYSHNVRGLVLHGLERYEEALEAFEEALRIDPKYVCAYNNKGLTLNNLNRYEEALSACEQALRIDPDFAYAHNNKGNALYGLKRYEEALSAYNQATSLNPNDPYPYNGKGLALYGLKRYDEALLAYNQAIRLDPNFRDAYSNKSSTLDRLGRPEAAQQARERVRELG
jgi:tetratricopeptide (TPR) repeat protein